MPLVHILDDDAHVRAATSYLLASRGYTTQIYGSAAELLDQAKLDRGCLLLDLRMPDLDGFGILARLAEREITIPTIMMTGHGDLNTAIKAMKLGAVDFIEKPYKESDLLDAVARALDLDTLDRRQRQGRSDALAKTKKLSPRELQILRGLLGGLGNKAIARTLQISPRTVEMHRASIMSDLECSSLSDAVRIAIDAGLEPLNSEPGNSCRQRSVILAGEQPDTPLAIPLLPPATELLEGAIDCIFLLDHQWRFTYLNRNAVEKIGLGRDLRGTVIWESFPLAVDTLGWTELHRSAAEQVAVRFQFFEPDVDCWFDVNVCPVAQGLQVAFRDITAERQKNVALQMSEETLRLALEAAGDGAWEWNFQTGKAAMSGRFVRHLGYSPEEFPADITAIRELVHADDWPMFIERLDEHLEGRSEAFSCEYRWRRRDGSWCWNLDRGRVIERDPQSGRPLRMVGTACDVSERKAQDASATEALERIALAQRNAGAGIWDLDLDTRRLRLCARTREMHGLSPVGPSMMSEADWAACVHPDDLDVAREALQVAISTNTGLYVRYRTLSPDGQCRWVFGLGSLVSSSFGQKARFVGINIDVTDTVEATLTVQRMQSEIIHLSRFSAMGALATTLAHELNQPLTAIAGFVGGIRRYLEVGNPEERDAALQAIDSAERSTQFAAEVVRKLREQASDDAPERKRENLSQTIGEAVQLCDHSHNLLRGIEVKVDSAVDSVVIDRVQIERVLLNLFRNACEAMELSGSTEPIRISATSIAESQVVVRVSDAGAGVPDGLKEKIFEASFTTKTQGMGLGLSICRTIVENHGGHIWVERNDQGGADFCFTLGHAKEGVERHGRAQAHAH